MKINILDLEANILGNIELPVQFNEQVRPDLIRRSFLSITSGIRHPYGASAYAGKRQKAEISRRRRDYKTAYGKGISRAPRKTMSSRGSQFIWMGAFAPGTVKGRRAHPPKSSKIFIKNINRRENRKAIRSSIAATLDNDLVRMRGHKFNNAPIILDDKIESITKSKDLAKVLFKIGLKEELERLSNKEIRAGKGKFRGRKYRQKTGPLIIVSSKCNLIKSSSNLQGIDIIPVNSLNTYFLAPGGHPGRLTIWSKSAIETLGRDLLFTNKNYRQNKAMSIIQKDKIS